MEAVQARKQRMISGALTDQEVRSARIEELKMLFTWTGGSHIFASTGGLEGFAPSAFQIKILDTAMKWQLFIWL